MTGLSLKFAWRRVTLWRLPDGESRYLEETKETRWLKPYFHWYGVFENKPITDECALKYIIQDETKKLIP